LPSVVTHIAGVREVLPDSFRFAPVPVGDSHSLAAAMRTIMRMSPFERRQLGQGLRKTIAERFSLDNVLDQWESLYSEALNANPQRLRLGRAELALGRTLQLQ
jgi:glycosyltransferase involved in cell wall biosynthesis